MKLPKTSTFLSKKRRGANNQHDTTHKTKRRKLGNLILNTMKSKQREPFYALEEDEDDEQHQQHNNHSKPFKALHSLNSNSRSNIFSLCQSKLKYVRTASSRRKGSSSRGGGIWRATTTRSPPVKEIGLLSNDGQQMFRDDVSMITLEEFEKEYFCQISHYHEECNNSSTDHSSRAPPLLERVPVHELVDDSKPNGFSSDHIYSTTTTPFIRRRAIMVSPARSLCASSNIMITTPKTKTPQCASDGANEEKLAYIQNNICRPSSKIFQLVQLTTSYCITKSMVIVKGDKDERRLRRITWTEFYSILQLIHSQFQTYLGPLCPKPADEEDAYNLYFEVKESSYGSNEYLNVQEARLLLCYLCFGLAFRVWLMLIVITSLLFCAVSKTVCYCY